jgi:rhamnose transport system permease protein
MRRTVFGRRCYAIGLNKEASWAAGIDVAGIKIKAYTLAGALAGVAALVWIGQYGSARGDNADGAILFVVTAVVLGGVDINGGRGAILGVVLALFLRHDAQWHRSRLTLPALQTIVLGGL